MNEFSIPSELNALANDALNRLCTKSGRTVFNRFKGEELLTQRNDWIKPQVNKQISANGSCHLMQTKDTQWIALNLSRPCDWELLPALFKNNTLINNWNEVRANTQKKSADELINQGRQLGLAISLAKKNTSPIKHFYSSLISEEKKEFKKNPLTIDLSSLWAGPLCSQLLLQCGAQVIKIESTHRSEKKSLSANNKSTAKDRFYQQINQDKEMISIDFHKKDGIRQLNELLEQADIIIEGSRPRALKQLGIDAEYWVREKNKLWLSITGYGRSEPQCNWIAYGDDAAISAGLYQVEKNQTIENKPAFVGDAIADPLTGLHAALITHQYWQQGIAALLDVNLHTVASYCAQKIENTSCC